MSAGKKSIADIPADKMDRAVTMVKAAATAHIVTANVLSALQITSKSDYAKKLKKM